MASDNEKKTILKSVISSPKDTPSMVLPSRKPTTSLPEGTEIRSSEFTAMMREGQKRDPVAGSTIVNQQSVKSSYYLTEKEHTDFKVICAINKKHMASLIRESILDYIKENKHLLK